MKIRWFAALVVVLMAGHAFGEEAGALKTQKDKTSYAIGVNVGNNLKGQSIDVDPDLVLKGMKDALSGGTPLMTDNQVKETLTALQKDLMTKAQEKAKQAAEKNKTDGEAFLAENKKKEGVVITASGLQYKVIKNGDGKKPAATDTVEVNYKGTLIDGTEFDSSYKRGQTATFPVNQVIAGWTEALQLMPVGSKWQLFVPSGLAYGERGAGNLIGPNSTLVFEVDLIGIKADAKPEAAPGADPHAKPKAK